MKEQIWNKEELSAFCLEFSLLMEAGISVGEVFSILSENEADGQRQDVLFSIYEQTVLGASVCETMRAARIFPPYMLQMIEIGEKTGHLADVLAALSRYYEERIRMKRLIRETVTFPIILLVTMLAVVVLLITQVLPVFQSVFAQLGGTLPRAALFFLDMGVAVREGRHIALTIFIAMALFALAVVFCPNVHILWNRFWTRKFSATKLGENIARAQFASALSMTIRGGLDMDSSFGLTAVFCKNSMLFPNILSAKQKLQDGCPFTAVIEEENLMKPMYCRLLTIGIKTGNIDKALSEIARRSEEEAAAGIAKAAACVEPVVVITLSVVVGFMLLTVMSPLVGIMTSLS